MSLRAISGVAAGLIAGIAVALCAVRSLSCDAPSGLPLLIILATWAVGVAGTASGTAGAVYYGIALGELRRVRR